jgi:hypothetical protein
MPLLDDTSPDIIIARHRDGTSVSSPAQAPWLSPQVLDAFSLLACRPGMVARDDRDYM